jgi:endonuclease YncB( thermonuclease family)
VQQIRENAHVTISPLQCSRWDGDFLADETLRYHALEFGCDRQVRYGRTIADMLLPDGTNVNHTLVKDELVLVVSEVCARKYGT